MHGPFIAPVHKDTKTHMEKLINAIQVQLMLRLGCGVYGEIWKMYTNESSNLRPLSMKCDGTKRLPKFLASACSRGASQLTGFLDAHLQLRFSKPCFILGRYNLDANDWTLFQTSAGWDAALAETQLIVLGQETRPLTLRGCDLMAEMVHEMCFRKWQHRH